MGNLQPGASGLQILGKFQGKSAFVHRGQLEPMRIRDFPQGINRGQVEQQEPPRAMFVVRIGIDNVGSSTTVQRRMNVSNDENIDLQM